MHEFLLRKDRHGEVRFFYRKSSRATWLPEGEGFPVFKTIPLGAPALATAKSDHQWNRTTVTTTIRQWYRYISMRKGEAEQTRVRNEWEARFENLPPDGDTNQLASSMKPKWHALPRFRPVRGFTGAGGDFTDEMENPVVDPVTGPGHTTADVNRKVEAYKMRVRGENNTHPPIFQGDYLFAKPRGGSLGLHRVAHGACLYHSTAADISFTTAAYHHRAQEGYDGFWGTFELKENANYNPNDRKSGGKYERHYEMTRSEVILPDVQVLPGPELRIHVDSLRALADVTTEQPRVPDAEGIPASHATVPRAGHGSRGGRGRGRSGAGGRGRKQAQRRGRQGAEEDESEGEDGEESGEGEGEEDEEGEHEEEMNEIDDDEELRRRVGEERQQAQQDRKGLTMEVQGCDSDCDFVCSICDWEPCRIEADYGNCCDILLLDVADDSEDSDDGNRSGVANRHLRMPAAAKGKRRFHNI